MIPEVEKKSFVVENSCNRYGFFDVCEAKRAECRWQKNDGGYGWELVAKIDEIIEGEQVLSEQVLALVVLNGCGEDPELRFLVMVDDKNFGIFGGTQGFDEKERVDSLKTVLDRLPYPLQSSNRVWQPVEHVLQEIGDPPMSLTNRGIYDINQIQAIYGEDAVKATWQAIVDWCHINTIAELKKLGFTIGE